MRERQRKLATESGTASRDEGLAARQVEKSCWSHGPVPLRHVVKFDTGRYRITPDRLVERLLFGTGGKP